MLDFPFSFSLVSPSSLENCGLSGPYFPNRPLKTISRVYSSQKYNMFLIIDKKVEEAPLLSLKTV